MFKRLTIFLLLIISFSLVASDVFAKKDLSFLRRDFDAKFLNTSEKKALQTSLAMKGIYKGTVDGQWGKGSQASLKRFSESYNGALAPTWVHAVRLLLDLDKNIGKYKWKYFRLKGFTLTTIFPSKLLKQTKKSKFSITYSTGNKDLSMTVSKGGIDYVRNLHTRMQERISNQIRQPYRVRKEGKWITEITSRSGFIYLISLQKTPTTWDTISVFALNRNHKIYNAIVTGITTNRNARVGFPKQGLLNDMVKAIAAEAKGQKYDFSKARKKYQGGSKKRGNATGTGFFINKSGHVLTNSHVVRKCRKIVSDNRLLEIVANSAKYDLAVLKHKQPFTPKSYARFSPAIPALNSDVTVGGYPYSNILGGFNITRGAISGRSGLKGDISHWQISAALQSGNSGGAVVSKYGNVVGVAVAKLDALKVAKYSGDLPQNVNFAVKGSIAKAFLASHSIPFELGSQQNITDPEKLGQNMDDYTLLVKCVR